MVVIIIALIVWGSSSPDDPMAAQMGGSNILINGALAGPLVPLAGGTAGDEMTINGWKLNNARISIVDWPAANGRPNVIKVADAGSFTEMAQTVDTVPGQKYTISYDVWAADTETNTANKAFCSSVDSNGQLIIRAGETVSAGVAGGGNCGSAGISGAVSSIAEHCHGQHRLCPESSDHWLTVSGTYVATAARTTIALHGEGSLDVYFSQVFMTTAEDHCKASTDSTDPEDPTMCQCSHLKESQQGTGNVRNTAQGANACTFTSGNTGTGAEIGYGGGPPSTEPISQWLDAAQCASTPPRSDPASFQYGSAMHEGEICIDVDTSSHHFTFTPHYVASFGGTGSEHHMTTGASSVYHASPTGFRVYIKKEQCLSCMSQGQQQTQRTPLTAILAKERGYHINWVAETAPCTGAGDSTGVAQYSQAGGASNWQQYCWTEGPPRQCTGVFVDVTFPPGAFLETPVIVASLHGTTNHADARGGSSIYSATPNGFRVYVHSTAGTGATGTVGTGITPAEVMQWGWKIVYLASEDPMHSGQSSGIWSDAGEHLVETIVCHNGKVGKGGPNFAARSRVNYVTSITGNSHHWTSDGASSVYSPTSDSFRIYMFREGDDAGVPTCVAGQFNTLQVSSAIKLSAS